MKRNGQAKLAPRKRLARPNDRLPAHMPMGQFLFEYLLTMEQVIRILSLNLDEQTCVVSDVGDGLFGAVGIRTSARAEFIAPAYNLSMLRNMTEELARLRANKVR